MSAENFQDTLRKIKTKNILKIINAKVFLISVEQLWLSILC